MRLALEVGEQPRPLLRRQPLLLPQHLDVRLDARERRAQLVRGVGDEAPLRLERLVERAEHRVEGGTETRELVPSRDGNPLARLARLRDPLGGAGEAPHGYERGT